MIWYLGWTAFLAVLLFFPVSRLSWVFCRGLVITFAALFNSNLFGIPGSR